MKPDPAVPDGLALAIGRGLRCRCPRCGEGRVFVGFLRVAPACESCGLALAEHRADDLPPYIVIFLVGHLVGFAILETEMRVEGVPLWFQFAVWPAVTLALALGLLRPVKAAVVGLQYALGMHGFGPARSDDVARVAGTRETTVEGRRRSADA